MSTGVGEGRIWACKAGMFEATEVQRENSYQSIGATVIRSPLQFGFVVFAGAFLFLCANPTPSVAQDESPPPVTWSFEGEVGASIFFGATDQTTVATKVGLDRKGSRFELENDLTYLYGEATGESGNTFVNKRFWSVGSNLDYRGFSRVNPYVFGSALSSLEKAIAVRYEGGVGAKFTAMDSEATRLDFAVAVLGERTEERSSNHVDPETLARWTGEFNFRKSFAGDRTVLQAKADYNPVFDEFANYTIGAETSVAFKLSDVVSLKLSLVDNFDSRAEDRGALDNNDGRILFSVLSSF